MLVKDNGMDGRQICTWCERIRKENERLQAENAALREQVEQLNHLIDLDEAADASVTHPYRKSKS